jgi:hypothetical protein
MRSLFQTLAVSAYSSRPPRRPMRKFPSAFALANRQRRVRTVCYANPVPTMCGSRAAGIQRDRATGGTTATGRGHRMRARTGSIRITTVNSISTVGGKAVVATSPMTIAGTEADSETNVAILAPTIGTTTGARREGLTGACSSEMESRPTCRPTSNSASASFVQCRSRSAAADARKRSRKALH